MKTIYRRIDLTTLKKNPNAGRTEYQVAGRIYETPEEDGTITRRREVHTVRTLAPAPTWLYQYEPMKVQCEECLETVWVDQLEEDWGDEDVISKERCPKCGHEECLGNVRWTFETVDDALKRRAG